MLQWAPITTAVLKALCRSYFNDRVGADVLATSYTLSQLIKHIKEYDVIVCGKQTTDGDTAQVGPEIAEFLSIPHIPYVKEIVEIKRIL